MGNNKALEEFSHNSVVVAKKDPVSRPFKVDFFIPLASVTRSGIEFLKNEVAANILPPP